MRTCRRSDGFAQPENAGSVLGLPSAQRRQLIPLRSPSRRAILRSELTGGILRPSTEDADRIATKRGVELVHHLPGSLLVVFDLP